MPLPAVLPNQHWALVGQNGAGQHLLMRELAGAAGQNAIIVAQRHHFKNLSNIPTFYYQQRFNATESDDALPLSDYLATVARIAPAGSWTLERVTMRLDLIELLDKQIIKLSNGETRRALIAAALLRNPRMLLFDQPYTGLDPAHRVDLDALFAEIAADGIQLVIATRAHEIPEIITHVAIVENGAVVDLKTYADFHQEQPRDAPFLLPDGDALSLLLSARPLPLFNTVIRMDNVTVRYGDKKVLDGVSWEVSAGERWWLQGANGAGKSTLLSLVNGDHPQAYANSIVLFDRRRGTGESIWDIKRNIGYLSPEFFQYFPPGMTVIQAIESGFYDTAGLFRRPEPAKTALCRQWLDVFGMAPLASLRFGDLPADAQRLCLLARALVKIPPLLLLDEPCQGLDNRQKQRFMGILNQICRRLPVTLVYVSHYEDEIPECVTRCLRLEHGKATAIDRKEM